MSGIPAISVIIPTRALCERAALLRRAIDSVLSQEAVRAVPLVVINGTQSDAALTTVFRADRRLRTTILPEADLPGAIRAGRSMVDTPYFAELDDDDMLLPGALALRICALTRRTQCDVVVTNGIRRSVGGDSLHVPDMAFVERDPLRAFLDHNWLLPGSWLCRTDRVGEELFEGMPRFRECTYLALRFATERRIMFVSTPTVVYDTATPRSESKSREYVLGSLAAQRRILELPLPEDVRSELRTGLATSCLAIAHLHRREGRFAAACGWYLRSGLQPGAPQYFARRLLRVLRGS